ncbi:LysM peptidoglycan-binding domain-containing M23 family metallopeptidase [Zongyangia hominis]|uniref:Peptidoglycan DD-metalloendopeptidase family protein n=1 Tax=Zongyangia hominis TaxID=2763677 RepID=A0A926ECU7_9FIRM|nr:M23 family metallopeptidase [Zongyangia hominis]MBC8570049.1 peptidoglycan DD-metalloendopeptidase family protein [Zongyangia hominis]
MRDFFVGFKDNSKARAKRLWRNFTFPFKKVAASCVLIKNRVSGAYRNKGLIGAVGEFFYVLFGGIRANLHLIKGFLNYAAPICAAFLLVYTVSYFANLDYAISVEYQGVNMGYIENEDAFDQAEKMMQGRIVYEENQKPVNTTPSFTLEVVEPAQLLSVDKMCDNIIRASGSVINEATGLYIDNKFMGATKNGDELENVLDGMLAQYRTGSENEQVDFIRDVQVKQGLYPESSIVDLSSIETVLTSEVEGEKVYTVVSGDDPWGIAEKNDLSLTELTRMNPGIEDSLLIGQEVLISRSEPFLGVQVTRTETYTEDIPYQTEKTTDNRYYKGYSEVKTKGQNGVAEVTADITYVDGVETERVILASTTIKEPVTEKVVVGSASNLTSYGKSSGSAGISGFLWPAAGGYISCGYGGYAGHYAIDIAGTGNGPVYASMSGTVVYAKNQSSGYGRHILINHGNGVYTLYAHCNALYVTAGQRVNQGDVIGQVGQTGNAYGRHLHFEIRVNGRYMNPAQYF